MPFLYGQVSPGGSPLHLAKECIQMEQGAFSMNKGTDVNVSKWDKRDKSCRKYVCVVFLMCLWLG